MSYVLMGISLFLGALALLSFMLRLSKGSVIYRRSQRRVRRRKRQNVARPWKGRGTIVSVSTNPVSDFIFVGTFPLEWQARLTEQALRRLGASCFIKFPGAYGSTLGFGLFVGREDLAQKPVRKALDVALRDFSISEKL
jgi:hypothetical protein